MTIVQLLTGKGAIFQRDNSTRLQNFSIHTMITKSLLFLICCQQTLSKPFLFNAPQALTSLVSSASASLTGSKAQKLELDDDDDFFKQAVDDDNHVDQPGLIQTKLNTILQKFRFLTAASDQDDFQKEQDDFDKEFDKDFASQDLVAGGYFYDKPKSAKQEAMDGFSPASVGVFFMELIGSLVGLAYGAAAQLNYQSSTTTASSVAR